MRTIRHRSTPVMLAAVAATILLALAGSGAVAGAVAKNRAGVTIKDFKFHKKTLQVAKGTRVVFKNKDGATHTATDKGVFNTGKIKHGKSKAITFKRKGTFRYICTIHPFMKGKIVVG